MDMLIAYRTYRKLASIISLESEGRRLTPSQYAGDRDSGDQREGYRCARVRRFFADMHARVEAGWSYVCACASAKLRPTPYLQKAPVLVLTDSPDGCQKAQHERVAVWPAVN